LATFLSRIYPGSLAEEFSERRVNNTLPSDFSDFSFDELSALANNDPAAFDELRSALIKTTIRLSGNASLLLRLQRRLDEEAATGTPRHLAYLQLSDWLSDTYRQLSQYPTLPTKHL
jgi:hypothetical protein